MAALYFGNYQICWYLYPEDVEMWWACKGAIYNMVIAIGLYLLTVKSTLKEFFILSVFNGLVINNIVDRLIFKEVSYEWNDLIIITVVILISYAEYKWRQRKELLIKKY